MSSSPSLQMHRYLYDQDGPPQQQTIQPYVHDGCSHLLQVRNQAYLQEYTSTMCSPQIISFANCGHFLEYHCIVGRSFQTGEDHPFCTFNIPQSVASLGQDPYLAGLCPECREAIESHDKLILAYTNNRSFSSVAARFWQRFERKLTVAVNMHSYPLPGWTSSTGTRRLRKYHCEDCRLDDRALRKAVTKTELGLQQGRTRWDLDA